MGKTFFTADQHFNHEYIHEVEKRPFSDHIEMNNYMIQQWNEQVGTGDTVEVLGDFIMGTKEEVLAILTQLNGTINMVAGNWDDLPLWQELHNEGYINELHELGKTIDYNGKTLLLTHYPLGIGVSTRTYNIHGHIHSRPSSTPNQINVGVDSPIVSYRPFMYMVTLEDLDYIIGLREADIQSHVVEYKNSLFNTYRGVKPPYSGGVKGVKERGNTR